MLAAISRQAIRYGYWVIAIWGVLRPDGHLPLLERVRSGLRFLGRSKDLLNQITLRMGGVNIERTLGRLPGVEGIDANLLLKRNSGGLPSSVCGSDLAHA